MAVKTNISLQTGPVIKTGVNNLDGKYSWTPTDNGFETYGIFIEHEQKKELNQSSHFFHIKGEAGSSTTTIKLSTGPSYTSTSTSSVPSSTETVVSTSSSDIASTTALPTSNLTLSTTLTTPGQTGSPTTSGPASASSSAVQTPGAAVANLANGGLAVMGGLVLAFAL